MKTRDYEIELSAAEAERFKIGQASRMSPTTSPQRDPRAERFYRAVMRRAASLGRRARIYGPDALIGTADPIRDSFGNPW